VVSTNLNGFILFYFILFYSVDNSSTSLFMMQYRDFPFQGLNLFQHFILSLELINLDYQ